MEPNGVGLTDLLHRCQIGMLLYLGKANLSDLELPMQDATLALWLQEATDFTASLETEEGHVIPVASTEEWRIFTVEGPGVWRARFCDRSDTVLITYVTVVQENGAWKVRLSEQHRD